jgi:hypothetical protein
MLRSPCRYLASLYCRSRWGGGRIRFVVVTHRPRRRRVNHMPKNEAAIAEIKALEDRRYRAMLAGDMAVLDELCSDDLLHPLKSRLRRQAELSAQGRDALLYLP